MPAGCRRVKDVPVVLALAVVLEEAVGINSQSDASRVLHDSESIRRMRFSLKTLLILPLTFAILSIAVGSLFSFNRGRCPSRSFDQEMWSLPEGHTNCGIRNFTLRSTMADAVVRNALKRGMSHGQVGNLLGPPDEDYGMQTIYHIGPERRWMSIDYEVLILSFSRSGVVTDYELKTD